MSSQMTTKLTVLAMLTALTGAATPALAASKVGGASPRPHVRILPLVTPRIHPRVHVPSISHHVGKQLMNKQTQQNTAPADGLTTTGQGDSAALLLPAIQAAREAAHRSSSNAGKGKVKYMKYELKDVVVSSY